MGKKNFSESVIKILHDFKFEYWKEPERYQIPIVQDNKKIAYLRPVTADLRDEKETIIQLLARWREEHWQAYPTVFKVTIEGTEKWWRSQLVERPDRILFFVMSLDNRPIGHLGLSNFNFEAKEAEIDNVVRGEAQMIPGVMTSALLALDDWAFSVLGLKRLFLRVFYDNERAIRLYERCGFIGVKKIPLHKFVEGDSIKYEEIKESEILLIDRYFYLMEIRQKI